MAAIQRSSEDDSDPRGHARTRVADLVAELSPNTDLASLVERVARDDLPWVVVPAAAITAWERRDPAGWENVRTWLDLRGIAVVRI